MSIDKFGKSNKAPIDSRRGPPGVGFVLTPEGDYDIQNHFLKNLKSPADNQDAATKQYVDESVDKSLIKFDHVVISDYFDSKIKNIVVELESSYKKTEKTLKWLHKRLDQLESVQYKTE